MRTDITVVLDRSGSMASTRDDAMNGFNALVADQKRVPGEAGLSLVQFDDQYQVDYSERPMSLVPELTPDTYQPRGSTALLDALGRTIDDIGSRLAARSEAARPDKVVVVTITDGQENASRTFNAAAVSAKIAHQRDVYKWEFIFVGSNQDAIMTAGRMNIPAAQALSYRAGSRGTRAAFDAVADMLSAERAGLHGVFTVAHRDEAMTPDEVTDDATATPR
jgi:uncharacterized protein YegL